MKHLTVPFLAFVLVMIMEGYASCQEPSALSTAAQAPAQGFEIKTDGNGRVPQEQIRQLLRIVANKDLENDRRRHDYTYSQRKERRKLDHEGNVKLTETETREVLTIYGQEIERLIAKNDKPLSEKIQS